MSVVDIFCSSSMLALMKNNAVHYENKNKMPLPNDACDLRPRCGFLETMSSFVCIEKVVRHV